MRKQLGFTFVELILYLTLVTIILTALVPFALTLIDNGAKSEVTQEVNDNLRYITERITYEIRNSSNIVSMTPTSLTLSTITASTDPTVLNLVGGNLSMTEGSDSAVLLNSDNTKVSSLLFTNLSSGSATKNIQFDLTIQASFSAGREEYQASASDESDAEIRSN